jgi:hypothetical protein
LLPETSTISTTGFIRGTLNQREAGEHVEFPQRRRTDMRVRLGCLVLAYGLFAAGFMALLAAVAGRERVADVMNTMTAMGLGLLGGCMFSAEQMPAFLRLYVTPYMPTAWFVQVARGLQSGDGDSGFMPVVLGLALLGMACVGWRPGCPVAGSIRFPPAAGPRSRPIDCWKFIRSDGFSDPTDRRGSLS